MAPPSLNSVLKKIAVFTIVLGMGYGLFIITQGNWNKSFNIQEASHLLQADESLLWEGNKDEIESSRVWYKFWTRGEIKPPIQANCSLLFKGDKDEIDKVKKKNSEWKDLPDLDLYNKAENCSWIQSEFTGNFYTSKKERMFPLGYALNVYNAPQQIFRFLKVIYRPHNVYCIHYDGKSETKFQQLMINIAKCIPNIIVPSKIELVIWAWHTIVDAQMNCLSSLLDMRDKYPWRYVITLCGKELPLRTNREIVQSLTQLNGTSAVELEDMSPQEINIYWKYKHVLRNLTTVETTKTKLGTIPFNFVVQKSVAYFGLSLAFVEYLLNDKRAVTFRKFMDKTKIPDEHFVATLFKVPGAPGGYNEKYYPLVPTVSKYIWIRNGRDFCNGNRVHAVCVVNSGDLHRLDFKPHPNTPKKRDALFHNKYFMEWDHSIMDCLESELVRRNMLEYSQDHPDSSTHVPHIYTVAK